MRTTTLDLRIKEEVSVRNDALHDFVYGNIGFSIAFVLTIFFLIQPVAFLHASTEDEDASTVVEEMPVEEEMIDSGSPVVEEVLASEETTLNVVGEGEDAESVTEEPTTEEEVLQPEETEVEEVIEEELSTDGQVEDGATILEVTEEIIEEDNTDESASGTDEVLDETNEVNSEEIIPEGTTATSSEEEVASTTDTTTAEAHTVVTDNNRYQFGSTECIAVGDGAFYCAKQQGEIESKIFAEDGVLAAPDAEGDLEIFIIKNGEYTQLTYNSFDDAAPFFDESSHSIVWHRMINDRYQIMRYDLEKGSEEQLTHSTENNMEPTSHEGVIVWQSWINGNWEVMMEEDGAVTQLSENAVHDIAPHINAEYIVWQTEVENEWYAHVHNRKTGKTEEIRNEDGHMIENPRFVLVYDARSANGDVETRGYDLETGKVVPLSATPTKAPTDIPEPDQTGEERALIQSKPKVEEEVVEVVPNDNSTPFPSTATTTTATSSSSSQPVTAQPVQHTTEVSTSTITVPDLVIPAFTPEE